MWDAEKDDDAAFDRRLDGVLREVGSRGKQLLLSEAVPPPSLEPTPAPAPASAPTLKAQAPPPTTRASVVPAPAPAPAPIVAPAQAFLPASESARHDFSPTIMQQQQQRPSAAAADESPSTLQVAPPAAAAAAAAAAAGGGTNLVELSALLEIMREQADHAEAKLDALRKAEDAKSERQRQEIEQLRAEIAARPPLAIDTIDEQQLAVLQTRLAARGEATEG